MWLPSLPLTVLCVDVIRCVLWEGRSEALSCNQDIVPVNCHHCFLLVWLKICLYVVFIYLTCAINEYVYSPGSLFVRHWWCQCERSPPKSTATADESLCIGFIQPHWTEEQNQLIFLKEAISYIYGKHTWNYTLLILYRIRDTVVFRQVQATVEYKERGKQMYVYSQKVI